MPFYAFKSKNGQVFRRFMTVSQYIATENNDGTHTLNDKIVKRVYEGSTVHCGDGAGWPILSDSAAVHPSQVEDAKREAQINGVPTDFSSDGRPILRDHLHRRKYLKSIGLVDMGRY